MSYVWLTWIYYHHLSLFVMLIYHITCHIPTLSHSYAPDPLTSLRLVRFQHFPLFSLFIFCKHISSLDSTHQDIFNDYNHAQIQASEKSYGLLNFQGLHPSLPTHFHVESMWIHIFSTI
jgi:hypothetical protein